MAYATWHHSSHLKKNNSCYLLFEQPSSGHFHATPFVSSYLCSPSRDLLASTKSTHCYFSPRSEGLMPLLALLISIRDALLTTYTPLPSHLSVGSHHEYLKLSHTHQIILISEIFYCRNGVLATNIINTARAPHQKCQHPTKGALLLAQAKRTRNISSVSSYRRSSSTSHDFLAFTRPSLASHLIRSNLPCLSPSRPGTSFYLISRITSAHLTRNIMLCDKTFLCPKTLVSSPISS